MALKDLGNAKILSDKTSLAWADDTSTVMAQTNMDAVTRLYVPDAPTVLAPENADAVTQLDVPDVTVIARPPKSAESKSAKTRWLWWLGKNDEPTVGAPTESDAVTRHHIPDATIVEQPHESTDRTDAKSRWAWRNHPSAVATSSSDTLPRGVVLNERYTVLRTLNRGGFGHIYAAIDGETKTSLVVKELFPAGTAIRLPNGGVRFECNAEVLEKLRNAMLFEIQTTLRLNHPGVTRILDFFEQNGTLYHCQEHINGHSLQMVVKKNQQISLQSFFNIALQLFSTLREIHAFGLIHCDLKPSNIIISEVRNPIIIDFGAAMPRARRTARAVAFTPAYAPRESLEMPDFVDTWSDVFSLFATMYFALTGSFDRTAIANSGVALPKFDGLSDDFHQELQACFEQGLQENFEDRYRTCEEAEAALSELRRRLIAEISGSDSAPQKIFLSYARQDEQAALQVSDCLIAAGHEVWRDEDALVGGRSWAEQIDSAIRDCDSFVLLCTQHSVSQTLGSSNVMRELTLAGDANRRIVPIALGSFDMETLAPNARFYLARDQWAICQPHDFEPLLQSLASPI